MYQPRLIKALPGGDPDGLKVHTISADGSEVDAAPFHARLAEIKKQKGLDWPATPGFVIFHNGAEALYLVLGWWANSNELFTSVSVRERDGWMEDPAKYSFCLWDLEVFWHERNSFITHLYSGTPNLSGYRMDLTISRHQPELPARDRESCPDTPATQKPGACF